MHIPIILAFVVLQCTLCLSIRVPVDWGDDSAVNNNKQLIGKEKNENADEIPNEYFQYPAKKPQFAIEIAANSGIPSPENYYKSHPIKPYTGLTQQFEEQRVQEPPKNSPSLHQGSLNYATPATTSFEILHPYKLEEPALQQLYKDPIFENIRYGLRDSNRKLQKYQNEAGQIDVSKSEYLESPEQIDRKKQPHRNVPTPFEIHRPQRQPVYYRYPPNPNNRENILNQKLRLPWNQNIGKVTPIHYRPLKKHLYGLRQQHELKYDDEGNEYPQLLPKEDDEDKPEGHDIYEKGNAKFVQFKGQVDDAINRVEENKKSRDEQTQDSRKKEEDHNNVSDDEEEFVPIKNYAQVRKTEITKHLPREAAIEDAESFEEIQNAPRLREAIKSKKAQIVYSEEGYEDSAYDHGKEQKHASDHERHGGYLKKKENSEGKYKTPSYNSNYSNTEGSKRQNQIEHGEKWDSDIKENEDETDSDYYESKEGSENSNIREENSSDNEYNRNKRNSEDNYNKNLNNNLNVQNKRLNHPQNDGTERNTKVNIPQNNLNSTIISTDEKNTNIKSKKLIDNNTKTKYPYYFQNVNLLSKNSPIRYAENFELIPRKSKGGSEFYDSRSALECPEVEDNVDPLPEKLKQNGHPDDIDSDLDDSNTKERDKFKSLKNTQRLNGLGEKIDCFKAKYFGQNPLDSPFFEEDIIENPEPITKPSLDVFSSNQLDKLNEDKLITQNSDLYSILQKIRRNRNEIPSNSSYSSPNTTLHEQFLDEETNFTDIPNVDSQNRHITALNVTSLSDTVDTKHTQVRRKRATPFTYEPYKIIRDSQIPDSKKTTTTGNISPLIKQLQSSRVIDKVTIIQDKDQANKKNNSRVYKDIGKNERQDDQTNNKSILSFVDLNTDQRRGEPRYEIRPANHKSQYSPVETKKAISAADYKAQSRNDFNEKKSRRIESTTQPQLKRSKRRKPTTRPFFDVSKYLPKPIDTEQNSASSTVKKIILTTTLDPPSHQPQRQKLKQINIKDNEYNDYENNEEEDEIKTSTTSKTTIRKRTRGTTTTLRPSDIEDESETPKLHLHTRFREYAPRGKTIPIYEPTEKALEEIYDTRENSPKYLEKKKKSSKSTLVTDTKSYGEEEEDDDDDDRKKEVDELIGVQHDMDDYIPLYERVVNKINRMKNENLNKKREHVFGSDNYDDKRNDDKYINRDDDDDDDDGDEDDDEDSYKYSSDDDEDEDQEEENDEDESEHENFNEKSRLETTTSEPTKRTLVKTTEASITTTESLSLKSELKPMVIKKKIEIHKEIPVNKTSPHVTQFKQDIKEIEIIKEMQLKSKNNVNKNIESLDFYKDENLAEEINKLSDVEVFRENLDLKSGPRHGGNYRSITPEELEKEKSSLLKMHDIRNKGDVETSQTEVRELVDVPLKERSTYSRRSGMKVNNEEKNAKFIELRDTTSKPRLHGGNLRLPQGTEQRRKSEKYVDIDDEEEEETSDMHGGNFKSYGNSRNTGRQMHGGNYRSGKLVQSEGSEEKQSQSRRKSKNNPISTTTPIYILDPSKRMYYYVDA